MQAASFDLSSKSEMVDIYRAQGKYAGLLELYNGILGLAEDGKSMEANITLKEMEDLYERYEDGSYEAT